MASPTLCQLLNDSARRWPDRVAVGTAAGDRKATYRDLHALTRDLAMKLRGLGVSRTDTVAIFSDNSMEFVLALFGVLFLGAAAAPLNPDLAPAEIAARLAAMRAKATIIPGYLYDAFVAAHPAEAGPAWKLTLGSGATGLQPAVLRPAAAGPVPAPSATGGPGHATAGDAAIVMLTAGTTGAPKVVPLTHANLVSSIDGIRTIYRLTPEDATLLVMPLSHGHGLIGGLLATLASGGAAWMPRGGRFHASTFWADLAGVGATWYTAVPTIHQILLVRAASDYPKDHPPRLRFIRTASAALAPAVLSDLQAAFSAPVIPAYGMTETAHQAASNPLPADGPVKPASVGVPTGVQIQVTNPDGSRAPAGVTGEIWIRGAAVTAGYRDNPDANAASFTGSWFHTGDLGYADTDGYLFLRGRIKEIIDRGGEKISPAEVDAVLQANPKIQDAMSFGVSDAMYGEEINAAVILRPGQTATEEELKQYCLARLSAFEVPKRFFFMTSFPHTVKGADDRHRLAAALGLPSQRGLS
jgi:oxalate---CoA ligase